VVKEFGGLFEAECDKKADSDGGDVDKEVAPGVDGFVRRMDVEHGGWFLGWGGLGRFGGVRWGQRDGVWVGHELVAMSLSWAGVW
jgi:hypothetical protein